MSEALERTPAPNRRRGSDRRISSRRSLELAIDGLLRPRNWGARLAHSLGLQGAGGVETLDHVVGAMRPSATPALRIGFASDFHAGPTTAMCLLREAADALARARLDVLLLGGDFVSVRARYIGPLARMIEDIPAPLGKFAVLGNHDLRANVDQVVDALEHVGVDVLVNESRRLAAPHSDVVLVGLDDPIRGEPDADAAFADATGLRVVLMHAPDGLFSIGTRPFALAVAGHTHGGQVRLPSGRAPVVPSGRLSRQYLDGMYRIGDKGGAMLVSRGVGCSTIPIRLFARPVVHVITLG